MQLNMKHMSTGTVTSYDGSNGIIGGAKGPNGEQLQAQPLLWANLVVGWEALLAQVG